MGFTKKIKKIYSNTYLVQQNYPRNQQKKPILSPYFLFLEELRLKALRDGSTKTMHEIAIEASQLWRSLKQEARNVYNLRSQQITSEGEGKQYLKTLEESYLQNLKVKKQQVKQKKGKNKIM